MSRRVDLLVGSVAALGIGVGAVTAPIGPHAAYPPTCLLRSLTGIPCPYCGTLRSFSSLLHGRVEDAFAHHPAGPFLAVLAALLLLGTVGRRLRDRPPLAEGRALAPGMLAVGVASGVAGAVRLLLQVSGGGAP